MALVQCSRLHHVRCTAQLRAVCTPRAITAGSRPSRTIKTAPGGLCSRPMHVASPINLPSCDGAPAPRRQVVMRSFLGVGAPEAILVAVVALVVFGPKGLADAAKSVGTALRSFQPTIREVVEVSQEVKGTLERELGLDELRDAARPRPYVPPPAPPSTSGTTSTSPTSSTEPGYTPPPGLQAVTEDIARTIDPNIEAKRAASEAAAWGGAPPTPAAAAAAAAAPAAAAAAAAAPAKDVNQLSIEELEAELARRKGNAGGNSKPPSA